MSAFISNILPVRQSRQRNQARLTCSLNEASVHHRKPAVQSSQTEQLSRRRILQVLAAIAVTPGALPKLVNATGTRTVKLGPLEKSEEYGYSFASPPEGWSRSTASLSSFRTATVFVNDEDGDSNINMVATPVPGDFRKLSSFGSVDNVLQTIIPKSGKDIEGSLIGYETINENNAYVFEYTITSRGVKRHLLTVFSLQPGRCLLTLTGQAKEENWKATEPVIKGVIESYTLEIID